MKQILTADLHLTDDPKDEYRWSLFEWLARKEWDELWILGDLTDKKDRHSAQLVNRIVDTLTYLGFDLQRTIHIVKGNHDCVDPNSPFFAFLDRFECINYYTVPETMGNGFAVLPFMPSTNEPWKSWPGADIALFHGTVTGAIAENGAPMSGVPPEAFVKFGKVWAGDIHVPQKIGNVEYVGAPYHIHFGDHFSPRIVRLTDWKNPEDLRFVPPIQKLLITVTSQADVDRLLNDLNEHTQIKVRVALPSAQAGNWHLLRAAVESKVHEHHLDLRGLELVTEKAISSSIIVEQSAGKSDIEMVHEFGKVEKLSTDTVHVGETIINET